MVFEMKKIIRAVRRRIHRLIHPSRPSLDGMDMLLERYIDFDNGFFIEAGANDGFKQSNTFYLEKKRGWKGILVEGIPELYEKCRLKRQSSTVYNCALVSRDYDADVVTMHYADLMSVVDGSLKSTDSQAQHLGEGKKIQKMTESYSVDVPARTLTSILDDYPDLPKIDLFSLDVEGFEHSVLSGLDFGRHRPRFILVEATFFDEVNQLLLENGYEIVDKLSHHDYLYRDVQA